MNMKMTARIALEMFESAVLCALLQAKRFRTPERGQTLPPAVIRRRIGIPPTEEGITWFVIRSCA